MIKSMTGYGYFEVSGEEQKITVEIKSVNHRYCDVGIKLPKKFYAFESEIRSLLKSYATRGKVDVYIGEHFFGDGETEIVYHEGVAAAYLRAMESACRDFSLENGVTAAALMRYPEVISIEEKERDVETIYPVLKKALIQACARFLQSKQIEGEHLQRDIETKLERVLSLVSEIEARSPELLTEYRKKLTMKVEELLGDRSIDEGVLATELTIYADKVCVDEETVRLKSHVDHMFKTLKKEEAVGRKLDFIAQEMNREANTILSKANDREISEMAIDLKTEIEKIREQVQNIE